MNEHKIKRWLVTAPLLLALSMLPGCAVKTAPVWGDTWPDETTINEKTDNGEVVIRISEVNTLDGFETIYGMECARISSQYTGTIEGKGAQQGVELNTKGDIKDASTWYFAYKKGIFVKHINKGTAEGVIDVPSQGLEIPFTREMTSEISLAKSK